MGRAETTNARVCGKCGNTIFDTSPQGLCSVCLFDTGLNILTETVGGPLAKDFGADNDSDSTDAAELFSASDDYELLEEIGRGGQGVVYRARQKSLNRTVALKIIGISHGRTKAHLKRFRLEAEAAARLNHPFVVPIHEIGQRNGRCYFSMGLVEGGRLDQIAKREPMSPRQATEVIAKLARTVHYAHQHGIVHRDIKPGNILLDTKGEPHLTDFGVARFLETENDATCTIEVSDTPSYMAPEQAHANNGHVSSATDVYGLGAVLYQLLAGQPPFAGGTTYETIKLLLDTEPKQPRLLNPKVDRDLSTICLKCLEKDPKRRYSSALALAEDLERWLKHEPILARHIGIIARGGKWVRRNPTSALLAASLIALATAAGWIVWKSDFIRHPLATGIAVLPFENLSDEKEQAFFADGVQDDILIKLAKIADLKVINRASVMQYRGKQNAREIGNALRVSHVLEGTVRRSDGKVHVNAQLVDTRTDADIWAEEYDRNLNDVFTIETDVAQSIAHRLRTKVSARERAAVQEWPTKDLVAYDLYARAGNLLLRANTPSGNGKADYLQAVDLLNQTVARDPSFFDAYCKLAFAHDDMYFSGYDHSPARLALAEAAVQKASQLRPNAGETHLARARNLYWGYRDYDGALAELNIARQTLPNDARIFRLSSWIQRRQGHWAESIRNGERSLELNPRDIELRDLGVVDSYFRCRHYAEGKALLTRGLALDPNDIAAKSSLGYAEFYEKADIKPLRQTIDSVRTENQAATLNFAENFAEALLDCALAERNAVAAKDALDGFGENRRFEEGVIARMAGDEEKAREAFVAARAEQEKTMQAQPNYAQGWSVLGLIDAGLGRKEDALREGWRAVQLLPAEKDAPAAVGLVVNLAVIAAWVGDKDLAFEQLESIIRLRSDLTYGDLKLMPRWDPLRGDPRFEKILEEAKQPVELK